MPSGRATAPLAPTPSFGNLTTDPGIGAHQHWRRQLLMIGGVLAIGALTFPIEDGRGFMSDAVGMGILGIVMPMLVVSVIVPDAIAGERERHTLATLLASRLPDRAILCGKLGFAVVTGWVTGIFMLLVALVAANLAAAPAAPLLYEPGILLAVLAVGLQIAMLTGAISFFVSLRASTAQEARQLAGVGMVIAGIAIVDGALLVAADRRFRRGRLLTR